MTNAKLTKGNSIQKEIANRQSLMQYAKTGVKEWIEINHGNGGNGKTICTDAEVIKQVCEIVAAHHEKVIKQLEKEFEAL